MQMSASQLPIRALAVSIGLLAIIVCSLVPSPARGETLGAAAETVAVVAETATDVPTEAAPVGASSAPAPAPTPVADASPESEEPAPVSSDSGSGTSVVPAVEKQVANVVTRVTGGEAAGQVKQVADTVSTATAPVKSITEAANVQPAVEKVAGSVQPAVDKVVRSASAVKQLPDEIAPTLSPNAPFQDLSRAGSTFQVRPPEEGQPPLPGPAPQLGDEGPSLSFENAVPLETRPVTGWIDGLDLRELFAPASPGPQAHGSLLESSPIDPVGVAAESHASPSEAPDHPSPSGPGPVSGFSTGASPGPGGGSFFVPIAALLALLALTAPATSRRWKAALAAPAPSQFVCALERPG